MKQYFEYPFNASIEEKLIKYYNETALHQKNSNALHGATHIDKMKIKTSRMESFLKIDKVHSVLDIGCSAGALANYFYDKCKSYVGVDISSELIDTNTTNNSLPNVTFRTFNGYDLQSSNEFDVVVMFDILEHAFKPHELMQSVHTALTAKGTLIMQVPTTGWLSELLFGKYHYGHLRYYDDVYLKKYITKYGFDVQSIKVYNSVPWSSRIIKYKNTHNILDFLCNSIPARLFPYFGSVFLVAQKKNESK